ncbi:MAG: L,D-transpeptidase, partial [Pseudomonadota bacterium]
LAHSALALVAVIATSISFGFTSPAKAQFFWGGSYGDNSKYDRAEVDFSERYRPGEVVVSFGDRRLYYVTKRGRAVSYPIAVPRPKSRWQGVLRVSLKRQNPDWTPTARMRRENPKLPRFVPGGHKRNPLGVRALYLGSTLYRIHGTDAPWTIGKNVSKGCIRMHNEHVVELYKRVGVGAKVTATWKKFAPKVRSAGTYAKRSDKGWRKRAFNF